MKLCGEFKKELEPTFGLVFWPNEALGDGTYYCNVTVAFWQYRVSFGVCW